MKHRFLDKINELILKGENQFFLTENVDDYFLYDFFVGVRSLSPTLFLFSKEREFDLFIHIKDKQVKFYNMQYKELNLQEAFEIKKQKKGFASRKKADLSKAKGGDELANESNFANILNYITTHIDKLKILIFVEDVEWQLQLYNEVDFDFLKNILSWKKSKNSLSFFSIKNYKKLLDFIEFEPVFITKPSIDEIFYSLMRLSQSRDLLDLKRISALIYKKVSSLREAVRLYEMIKDLSIDKIEKKLNVKEEKVFLKDVILKPNLKNKLKEIIISLKANQLPSKGMILYGPPGTGKTFIAKAISNELDMNFMAPSLADIKGEYVGESSKNVKRIFEEAKNNAPTILFLDEVDTIFPSRESNSDKDVFTLDIVNQFLVEIDGVKSNKDIFIICATNRIHILDSAIRSRFSGQEYKIDLPSKYERLQIIDSKFKTFKLSNKDYKDEILDKTEGMSGRDLFNLVKKLKQKKDERFLEKSDFYEVLWDFEQSLIENFKTSFNNSISIKEKVEVNFDDVIGYENEKKSIKEEINLLLSNPEIIKKFNISIDRKILITGESGNGKTFLGEAIAGEFDFYLIKVSTKDLITKNLISTLKNMEELLENIFKLGNITDRKGILLFFDDIEVLANNSYLKENFIKLLNKKELNDSNSKIFIVLASKENILDIDFNIYLNPKKEFLEIFKEFFYRDSNLLIQSNDEYFKNLLKRIDGDITIRKLKLLKEKVKKEHFLKNKIEKDKIVI